MKLCELINNLCYEVVQGSIDTEVSDVIIQLALFDDVIYG